MENIKNSEEAIIEILKANAESAATKKGDDAYCLSFKSIAKASEEITKYFCKIETNTGKYAASELVILCKTVKKPIIKPFIREILALCDKFGKNGESGGSASITATVISNSIKKLLLQEPICDITGIDEEWMDVTNIGADTKEEWWQNKRCSALLKNRKDGRPYYLDAIIWKNQDGQTYSGSSTLADGSKILSRQYIKKFPFKPKTFYIDRIDVEVAKDDWESTVKDERQLEAVWKYYDRYFVK